MPPRKPPLRLTAAVLSTLLVGLIGLAPVPAAADDAVGHLPTAEDFVTQQYEDFLGRAPDAAGLDYWADLVRDGIEPSALVESMATSAEFDGVIAPLVRLYFAFFGRPPDYEGLTYWTDQLRNGVTLEQVAQQFVLSGEFQSTYGSLDDGDYVELVYGNVLDRAADAGGRAYWVGQLGDGLERGRLMVAFSDSVEYRRIIGPRVQATMLYVGMLRRSPDTAGLDYWAGVISGDTPYRNVIAGFLGATEYGSRIGRIYTDTQPLTGVATRAAADRPALAVKIDNVDAARPQTAVDRADLVYEEMVEGNLTRLVAVFHSDLPDVVGPVRSVRTTDIHLLDQLNTPLLAASGANPGVLGVVAGADLVNVNALEAGGAYFRSSSKRAPHNLFARTTSLYGAAGNRGGLPPQLFTYRDQGTGSTQGTSSAGVDVEFGRADVSFRWSPTARGWQRTQNGGAHTVAGGVRLAPENVVVLEVSYSPSSIDATSPEAHTVGSGSAWVFTDGRVVAGTWSRSASTDPIALRDGNGQPIALTRGQTFVELAPPGSITVR
ncbi:MAG: DUF4214 domain-containing protein [Actinomycetota bacterium]